MSNRKSQKQMIREYLEAGNTLTPMEALTKFGCNRLSARIKEIREDGWAEYLDSNDGALNIITTEMIQVIGFNGMAKRVARYSLIEL